MPRRLGIRARIFVTSIAIALAVMVPATIALHDRLLVAAAGVGTALLIGAAASRMLSSTLGSLLDAARSRSGGRPEQPVNVEGSGELGRLAGSINRMAGEIERTVAALAEERARFALILEAMSDAVIALDAERRVTLMNPGALSLLHIDAEPAEKPLIELVRIPALQDLIARATGGDASTAEFAVGRSRRVLARATPQRSGGGCVVVMHDVTEIRRLETIRRDFVANVSHELRTPVSIVQANAETLLGGAMTDPVHGTKLLEALHRNAERLSAIITDLLELSRLEAGRRRLAREPVEIRPTAERAADALERRAGERRIAVAIDVPLGLRVEADASALEHVLVNLIDNAVKYTPPGGHVRISAAAAGDSTRIEVQDNGPGIAPKDRTRLFERFYRVDPGRSRDVGGTGLGLAIVKHLVDAMDGQVGVDAADPHGSIFWLELARSAAE